jgi:hypothetical protein
VAPHAHTDDLKNHKAADLNRTSTGKCSHKKSQNFRAFWNFGCQIQGPTLYYVGQIHIHKYISKLRFSN